MNEFLATAALINLGAGLALGIVFGGVVRGKVGATLVSLGVWVQGK